MDESEFDDSDVSVCTYCGLVSDSIDHVVPQHLLKRAEAMGLDLSGVYRMQRWEVPSCRECNSAIGGKLHSSIAERRACAQAHIRKKYSAYLKIPRWTDDELDELGPNIRTEVTMGLKIQAAVRLRIAWRGCKKPLNVQDVFDLFREVWGDPDKAA